MVEESFVVVAPNIRSGHNVGSIFRTADGAGIKKVYLSGYSPCPPHKEIEKVALGAEKTVKWEFYKQPIRLIKKLKSDGYQIVGLELTKNSDSIYTWQPNFPLALVIGNEVKGIPPKILKLCDKVVHLPMRGIKNSLNVSIAAGIAMYYISENL